MRSLEVINEELAAAREALSEVKGTPAEVYSRIVGYYRSVRNWNTGKREEYGERTMFKPDAGLLTTCRPGAGDSRQGGDGGQRFSSGTPAPADTVTAPDVTVSAEGEEASDTARIMLFIRPGCPSCPSAKIAAGRLGIPVDLYDADTDAGLAEAVRRNVMSTPTAILLSESGEELGRAGAVEEIAKLHIEGKTGSLKQLRVEDKSVEGFAAEPIAV
jgi:ribonucleoside-triphosphate reductase